MPEQPLSCLINRFVTGHDFSRAAKFNKSRPLAPGKDPHMDTLAGYRETYKNFSDDQLIRTFEDISDLQELAKIALREELKSRGYDQTKLSESLAELERLDTIAGLEIGHGGLILPYG